MIIRKRPNLLQLFFVVRGSVVLRVYPQILVIAGLSAVVVRVDQVRPGLLPNFSGAPFALLGIALSIFLGFRNSACYDRWWEARRHWGELTVAVRTLARQSLILSQAREVEARRRLLTLAMAFGQALVLHLRPDGDVRKASRHLSVDECAIFRASRNPPDAILRLMSLQLAALRGDGKLADIPFQMLDRTVAGMGAVQAACERIQNTPIPFGYTLLLHRTAYLFCFLLPFGFADTLNWGTPFATALVGYAFFGLDALGDELEEPFGNLANDLPIEAIADIIEINVREALGETDLPAMPAAEKYLLM